MLFSHPAVVLADEAPFKLSEKSDNVRAYVLANAMHDAIELLDADWRNLRDAAWKAGDEGASFETTDKMLEVASRMRIRVDSLRALLA